MMTNQRSRRSAALGLGLAALLMLAGAGCGGDDNEKSASTASTTSKEESKQLKVAFLLPGEVSDHGWNQMGKLVVDSLKEDGLDVQFTDSVNVATLADVYRQYASKGTDVIFAWGGQFTDGAVEVGKEFPDTKFVVNGSNGPSPPNVASLDLNYDEWGYVAGYVMAKLSKSGTIGLIGGQCFPTTAKILTGTMAGAKHADPQIKVLQAYTGDFEDPTAAEQTAKAMIDEGADVLTQNLNNGVIGVVNAAKAAGDVNVVTEYFENSSLGANVVAFINKAETEQVRDILKKVQDGTFKAEHYQYALQAEPPAVPATPRLASELADEAADIQQQIVDGELKVRASTACPK
jgi:basic membrane protein A